MAIITLSRQTASLGDEVGKAVAETLRYDFVDKQKISDALENLGLPAHDVERFDDKKPTIWQSLSHHKKKFIFALRAAIYDFARGGNVVIVGRGGQVLLQDITGTLHVRIVAPVKNRVQRLMDLKGYDKEKSEQFILRSDRDSSGFIHSFFDIDWDDENIYDIVLNTKAMSVATASSLITAAITAPEFKESSQEILTRLEDMALAQKASGALVGFPGLDLTNVDVSNGVVVLSGLASSNKVIEESQQAVSQIKGVREVRSNLTMMTLRGV
jgi:cytidylate kinase